MYKIISVALYGFIAFILSLGGINIMDWQWWVVMVSVAVIDIISPSVNN